MSEELDLDTLYEGAQSALAAKDFERATDLLKRILIQDENYKDASRLLAKLVKQQQYRWYRDWWLWGTIGAIALVALGIVLAGKLPSQPSVPTQPLMTSTSTPISPSQTPTATPTIPSPTPSDTPTSIPLIWERLWVGQELERDSITAIVIDPTDPDILYVGTQNAGIYKSIDGGLSWQPMHNGLGRAWIHTLVIDYEDSRILYAGVSLGGVYKTMDGGENWLAVNEGIEFYMWEWVSIVALDGQDSQHLYFTPCEGIYESLDGGETWAQIKETICPSQIVGLVVHPIDGKTLFAASWPSEECEGGVYKSVDAGRTWALTSPELEFIPFVRPLEIDSQKGDFLYVVEDSSLYGSSDSGENWIRLPQTCAHVPSIDPHDGAVAYCVNDHFMKTTDGGWTWQPLSLRNMPGRGRLISVSPHTMETILIGGQNLYISTDGGASWVERSSGLGGTRLELRLNPSDNSILYANSGAIYRSSTSGLTWEFFSPGGDLAFDADGTTLYALTNNLIIRSWDKGKTWENVPGSYEKERIIDIAAHPRDPGTLYVVNESASRLSMYVSSDSGNSWQEAGGIGDIGEIHHPILYFDHNLGEMAYAVGDWSVFRSNDAGNTWEVCAKAPGWFTHSSQSALTIDPRDNNRFFVATQGKGVLLSLDGCQSWETSNDGLGNLFVNSLAIDPQFPQIVYAGTDGGSYASFDGGKHWGQINEGLLGATVVYSVVVDPESNVYAATPYGVFKLEAR
jgi:photosystem II stability/assembly factor-like uncharacterized protein